MWENEDLRNPVISGQLSGLNDKLEFGGQGPQPMRYGSVGSPVSTGRRSKRDRAILGSERQIPISMSVPIRPEIG